MTRLATRHRRDEGRQEAGETINTNRYGVKDGEGEDGD